MTLYRVMNKTVGSAVATSRGCKKNTGKEIRDREYYTEGENLIFFRTVSTFFCIQFWFVCGYVDGADDPSSDVVSLHPANFFSLSPRHSQPKQLVSAGHLRKWRPTSPPPPHPACVPENNLRRLSLDPPYIDRRYLRRFAAQRPARCVCGLGRGTSCIQRRLE